jgi:uncharacterized protein (DUF58 family)
MQMQTRFTHWLQTQIIDSLEMRWVTPAYAGWLLSGLAIFFFAAASNTMAGWLYVMSGITLALLAISAILPVRSLRPLRVHRQTIEPVSVGDQITVELEIENPTHQPKTLLQVQDVLPYVLGKPAVQSIEMIPPHGLYRWVYYQPAQKRGIYHWEEVQLRTGAPLGLFWCRRTRSAKAKAIVYPTILSLTRCPLVDELGAQESLLLHSQRRSQMATEGITRNLRPYRFGDPFRLIHWRSSARLGELRVRELEVTTGGQEIIVALDSAGAWNPDEFEQAASVAASLFCYASRLQLNVKFWSAHTGLLGGHRVVLEALAATTAGEKAEHELPTQPLLWLTHNANSLSKLPFGSRWVLWPTSEHQPVKIEYRGLEIVQDQPLEIQLQSSLKSY